MKAIGAPDPPQKGKGERRRPSCDGCFRGNRRLKTAGRISSMGLYRQRRRGRKGGKIHCQWKNIIYLCPKVYIEGTFRDVASIETEKKRKKKGKGDASISNARKKAARVRRERNERREPDRD